MKKSLRIDSQLLPIFQFLFKWSILLYSLRILERFCIRLKRFYLRFDTSHIEIDFGQEIIKPLKEKDEIIENIKLNEELSPIKNKSNNQIIKMLPDNHLGNGIEIGGIFEDNPLRIIASDWAVYGLTHNEDALSEPKNLVRSGWLFSPNRTESHAVIFFKIHIMTNGEGYIHLEDVAFPEHVIWFLTSVDARREDVFRSEKSEEWLFTWK